MSVSELDHINYKPNEKQGCPQFYEAESETWKEQEKESEVSQKKQQSIGKSKSIHSDSEQKHQEKTSQKKEDHQQSKEENADHSPDQDEHVKGLNKEVKSIQIKQNSKKDIFDVPIFSKYPRKDNEWSTLNKNPSIDQNIQKSATINSKDSVTSQNSLNSSTSGHHILSKSTKLGVLKQKSDIITSLQFQNLCKKLPLIYQLYNWKRAYSARRDGSAYHIFTTKIKDIKPSIFLIKQNKGNVIGAFLTDSVEAGKSGRGEMFIFAFKNDSKVPEVYDWTGKNDFFVYLEHEKGLGIGMGIEYGIFMSKTLDKGSSAPTNTFGNNEPLSQQKDFLIDEVQMLGTADSVAC